MWRRTAVLAVAAQLVAGCGSSPTTPNDTSDPVSLAVQVSLGSFPIEQVVVEVSGPGIETPLAFNLTLADSTASGTMEVPAGSERVVTVTAFDAAGIATHRGSVSISVEEGENPSVTVTLEALQGDQPIEAHIGTLLVVVEPSLDTVQVGDTLRLSATVLGAADDTLDVQVRWATLDPALAWVDTAGLVTTVGAGEVGIVATYAGVGAQVTVVVEPIAVPALDFDATANQFAEIPDNPLLDLSTDWTIEAWINPTDVATGATQMVVSKWGMAGSASYTLEVGTTGNLRSAIHDGVNPTQALESSTALTNGTWQHVAVTLSNGTLRLYIDGAQDGKLLSSVTPLATSTPLSFGHEGAPCDCWPYDGLIAEVRIWNVARTDAEIADAMNSRLMGDEAGLVGYWPFDEGSGQTLGDATGNGLDAQLGSTSGVDADDPTWVADGGPPVS